MKIKQTLLTAILLPAIALTSVTYSDSANAVTPGCQVQKIKERTENVFKNYCNDERLINTDAPDPNAQMGEPGWTSWFFEIPEDQQCDLGLEFPDLIPDFDFNLERLNVCNVLQKVSANAVKQINEEFDKVEGQVDRIQDGVNDHGDIDLNRIADEVEDDLNDYFDDKKPKS